MSMSCEISALENVEVDWAPATGIGSSMPCKLKVYEIFYSPGSSMCSNNQFIATSAPLFPVANKARLHLFSPKPIEESCWIADSSRAGPEDALDSSGKACSFDWRPVPRYEFKFIFSGTDTGTSVTSKHC